MPSWKVVDPSSTVVIFIIRRSGGFNLRGCSYAKMLGLTALHAAMPHKRRPSPASQLPTYEHTVCRRLLPLNPAPLILNYNPGTRYVGDWASRVSSLKNNTALEPHISSSCQHLYVGISPNGMTLGTPGIMSNILKNAFLMSVAACSK